MPTSDPSFVDESYVDSSEEVHSIEVNDRMVDGWYETLYRTPDGRYFVWIDSAMDSDHGGAIFGEWYSDDDALAWLREHADEEVVKAYFPDAE